MATRSAFPFAQSQPLTLPKGDTPPYLVPMVRDRESSSINYTKITLVVLTALGCGLLVAGGLFGGAVLINFSGLNAVNTALSFGGYILPWTLVAGGGAGVIAGILTAVYLGYKKRTTSLSPYAKNVTPNDTLILFYLRQGPNYQGVRIEEIWTYQNRGTGYRHNDHHWIQWLFPLEGGSAGGYNKHAPQLTKGQIEQFKGTETVGQALRANVRQSFASMMNYYGLQYHADQKTVTIDHKSWSKCKKRWLKKGDHNQKRITRILNFLGTIGMHEEACAFYTFLNETTIPSESNKTAAQIFGSTTAGFWSKAHLRQGKHVDACCTNEDSESD